MKSLSIQPTSKVKGIITLSGDKSIAHRALIISAITRGKTSIRNFPANQDCLFTLSALQKLSIRITRVKVPKELSEIKILGKGLGGLKKPRGPLFLGNSGTTFRLLCGVLSGQGFCVRLEAGLSLSRRPMRRINLPLRMMGARISAQRRPQEANRREEYPPLTIEGGNLRGITYKMPVASAQVKSAIILAGLYARGLTRVIEPVKTRDHTERMLKLFQADIKTLKNAIIIKGGKELVSPGQINIPGDISSAAFFIVLAAVISGSHLVIKNICLNPLRTGVLRVLKRMGAEIKVTRSERKPPRRGQGHKVTRLEPAGDIIITASRLKSTKVKKDEIPSLIDELPILMVAASVAKGKTIFEGVAELRVKETDRINSMLKNLASMGARIKINKKQGSENIIIDGVKELRGSRVRSFADHRTAMSMIVAGLMAKGKTYIDDAACIKKSFPDFLDKINSVISR